MEIYVHYRKFGKHIKVKKKKVVVGGRISNQIAQNKTFITILVYFLPILFLCMVYTVTLCK